MIILKDFIDRLVKYTNYRLYKHGDIEVDEKKIDTKKFQVLDIEAEHNMLIIGVEKIDNTE